jgi:hypothetical protein
MVITAPTRITIEVTPLQPGEGGQHGVVAQAAHVVVASVEAADGSSRTAAYEPAPCRCLDDDDCTADHEHE